MPDVNGWRDLHGVLILGGYFAAILVAAELWARLANPKPEWTRKLVHLGGGLGCLFFPYLISSPWTVLAMAVGLASLFMAGGRTGQLKSLHRVQRQSFGSEYYPLAIFMVFVLADGEPWLYLSSVLVLIVADAFAALIGSRYGTFRFEIEDESKSLEGSLVFLVIAFLAIHLPLLLLTDLPRPVCVMAALFVAMLVTGFEAISLRGADNLFIPLSVCVILGKMTSKPLAEIVYQTLSLVGICLGVGLVTWRQRSFNVGGTLAMVLFLCGAWSLGSRLWALPIFLGFALFAAVRRFYPPPPGRARTTIRVRTTVQAVIVPFVLLMAANQTGNYSFFLGPFVAAMATVISLTIWKYLKLTSMPAAPTWRAGWALGAAVWLAVIVPTWLFAHAPPIALLASAVATLPASPLIELSHCYRQPARHAPRPAMWQATDFFGTLLAALLIIAWQAAKLSPPWHPPACF